ncbi:MAE_28990/MAE_18760 family HEPN-like nuclease [Methanobrevibacter arboriphilus]|uniref:MAE_28990/MAE_18760 family HEPN-like nuclease n=1 Tax=Methanobrevibacter arboriphilus TaxID=39441 RepID=UPI0005B2AED5|nr:MAE_28990/MAE_18760 family HEPN-like nuclease [Methanobrevibacter arboriphilus]
MNNLIIYLEDEMNWRLQELLEIRRTLSNPNITEIQLEIISKHILTIIYAMWEGFVASSIKHYSIFLNNKNLGYDSMGFDLLAVVSKQQKLIKGDINDYNIHKKIIKELHEKLESPKLLEKEPRVPILTYKEINNLLEIYGLPPIIHYYKKDLNKLANLRSKVAHGDFKVGIISFEEVKRLIYFVEDLMNYYIINISEYLEDE